MRPLAILLALAPVSLAHAQVAAPLDAAVTAEAGEELAVAREIIAISFPPEQREATMRSMVETVIAQMRDANPPVGQDPGVKILIERHLDRTVERLMPVINAHLPAIFDSIAVAYTNAFTLEELLATCEFARTPAGARFLAESANLMSDPAVATANRALYVDADVVQRRMTAELIDELARYYEANPPRE